VEDQEDHVEQKQPDRRPRRLNEMHGHKLIT
jgi:hypothetical protein